MINRCTDPNSREYHDYSGRGISVTDEWLGEFGYDVFAEWALASGYDIDAKHGDCTIDRIDVNKGYSPDNCRWITNKQQQNNRRDCHLFEYNGEIHSVAEWTEILNIPPSSFRKRLVEDGWSIEQYLAQYKTRCKQRK